VGKIPKWKLDMISYARFLPLEERKKTLYKLVNKLSDEQLGTLIGSVQGSEPEGARMLAHFLGGEGKPRKLELSSDEWEALLLAKPTEYSKPGFLETGKGWKPSTNPKFPASKGWEHRQINVRSVTGGNISDKLHNALGNTTSIRRKKVSGGYEYQIAEEFDLTEGEKGSFISARIVSETAGKYIQAGFPEFIEEAVPILPSGGQVGLHSKLQTTEALAEAGTPFPIQSTYFKADEKNVKVKPYKSYLTKLSAGDEKEFQVWFDRYVREVHGPLIQMKPDEKEQYYDYRGYWKDNRGEASKPMKRGQHLTDRYKIPGHHSFSTESKYYQPGMEKNTKVGQWIPFSGYKRIFHPPKKYDEWGKEIKSNSR